MNEYRAAAGNPASFLRGVEAGIEGAK